MKLLVSVVVVVSTSSVPAAETSTVSPARPMVNWAGTSVVWPSDTLTSLSVNSPASEVCCVCDCPVLLSVRVTSAPGTAAP